MYCGNCGRNIDNNAVFCVGCGVSVSNGKQYCKQCGRPIDEIADYCINCGTKLKTKSFFDIVGNFSDKLSLNGKRSKIVAVILALLGGGFGIHNFYLGYTTKAIWQVVLFVISFGIISHIWAIVEVIMILTGNIKVDGRGIPLAE